MDRIAEEERDAFDRVRRSIHHFAAHKCTCTFIHRGVKELLGTGYFNDLSLKHESHPAGEPFRLEYIVGNQYKGCLVLFVDPSYDVLDQAREHVFRRLSLLGISDLAAHIKFETLYTPFSWQKRYHLAKGATHGLSHNLMQLGYFRPQNKHSRYQNLYFVGASTRPGTGMPTAMISGRLSAQRIIDDLI